jgi:guanosine-3',5'-bis(diphosphate) 3'-pyrophosphohydrolase
MNTPHNDSLMHYARRLAISRHFGQKRKVTNQPYVLHPIRVAFSLADAYDDNLLTAAGYLHDILEDTQTTEAELRLAFGGWVTDRVLDVTKKAGAVWYFPTHHDSIKLKVADMLDNALDLEGLLLSHGDKAWDMFESGVMKLDYWDSFYKYASQVIGKESNPPLRALGFVIDRLDRM